MPNRIPGDGLDGERLKARESLGPLPEPCPLCAGAAREFLRVDGADYRRCGVCVLTFVPASQHADPARERARYAEHRNAPGDPGYRAFLDRLLAPLAAQLSPGDEGLDYGCGPGPTASVMMRERGFAMTNYDPFFFSNENALSRTYDFLVCTEVLEHVPDPVRVFEKLSKVSGASNLFCFK